jgi:hypothetical protein
MKRIIIIVFSMLLSSSALNAQDTLHAFGVDHPMFLSSFDQSLIGNGRFLGMPNRFAFNQITHQWELNNVDVYRFVLPPCLRRCRIAGVAFKCSIELESDTTWGALVTFDSGDYNRPNIRLTSTHIEYGQATDCYIAYSNPDSQSKCGPLDTVIDGYALYFDEPIMVTDTFFLGGYFKIERLNGLELFQDRVVYGFECMDTAYHQPHQNGERINFIAGLADDNITINCMEWFNRYWGSGWMQYQGYCPILAPDTDLFTCPAVEGLAVTGGAVPTLTWNVDGEHYWYEVVTGPADAPLDSLWGDTVGGNTNSLELTGHAFVPGVRYQARVRAMCQFVKCPYLDTATWSVWSDPVYFTYSDTSHTQPQGIHSPDKEQNLFSLSPNPAGNSVTITILNPQSYIHRSTLTLRDAAGREIRSFPVTSSSLTIPLHDCPAGSYLVTLTTPQATSTQRLIIK